MLADVPMVFILVGITAYTVLSGADFGAGLWTLIPGGGQADAATTRDHTRHAIGPVWEANHVWLIFVLTVAWTCYPVAFGSIVSTLSIPLFIAAVGIIFRGTTYALRSQLDRGEGRGVRAVENVFALSSVLTPFALATVIGAIATGRVPVGNARGDLVTSWLNPVSIMAGVLAVAFSGYLAAVYLAADARRLAERSLVRDFRIRGLAAGVVAGALALAGLFVVRAQARPLWHGLTSGAGLALVCVCALAGVLTLILVWRDRFGPARASAALAVAAVIAGWAAAQEPRLLPGLTVSQAAAGRATLIATIIGVAAGAFVLVPSLTLLYTLVLRGRLEGGPGGEAPTVVGATVTGRGRLGVLRAGVPQAGVPQAGVPQAGVPQAGVPQAGVPQAGVPQAGVPQAGVPQAGVPQAGVPQAGVPQAGVPQAGVPRAALAGGSAAVTLVAGAGLMIFATPGWALALGVLLLVACAVTVFAMAASPPERS